MAKHSNIPLNLQPKHLKLARFVQYVKRKDIEGPFLQRVGTAMGTSFSVTGKLASLNRSWQSKEGTYRALGMAGIEPTPSKSKDWIPLSP
jgi:hypothetical protein